MREAEQIAQTNEPPLTSAERLAMAQVGFRALIDEATGFQAVRPKNDLRKFAESQNKAYGVGPKRNGR